MFNCIFDVKYVFFLFILSLQLLYKNGVIVAEELPQNPIPDSINIPIHPPLEPKEIENIAQKSAILIYYPSGFGSHVRAVGSGVIVQQKGSTYYALTASHVFKYPNQEYSIMTHDGQSYLIKDIEKKDKNILDIAYIQFDTYDTKKSYQVIDQGDSFNLSVDDKVYICGWSKIAVSSIPAQRCEFLEGDFIGYHSSMWEDTVLGGYELTYSIDDDDTEYGMSGAAVLNAQGKLVGIHGRRTVLIDHKLAIPITNISPKDISQLFPSPPIPVLPLVSPRTILP